jgi:hypothetical protein
VLLRRLTSHANVTLRENKPVIGLLFTPDGARVIGVRTTGADSVLYADLIVDTCGRHSSLPDWLARLPGGTVSRVTETIVESGTHYISRWFHLEPRDTPDWHCFSTAAAAGTRRSVMMMRAEEDRWGVVLLAALSDPLPSDDAGFLDFAAGLGDGALSATLARARPISPIHRYRQTPNRLRHYDRLTAWPAGLVAIADSVCALDPYFGLGMTVAARGADCLRQHLAEGREPGLGFQKTLASMVAKPWRLATGRHLDGLPVLRDTTYLERVYKAATTRPEVAHAVLAEQHLLRAPNTSMDCVP